MDITYGETHQESLVNSSKWYHQVVSLQKVFILTYSVHLKHVLKLWQTSEKQLYIWVILLMDDQYSIYAYTLILILLWSVLGSTFAVDRTTGVLSTSLPLLASGRSTYDFSVRARDTSSPYYETICRVNVIVFSQETTNRPIFTQPPSESTIYRIYEVF